MDRTFRRWTAGAVVAAIICLYASWWAGSTSGADDLCTALGIQTAPDCVHNSDAHIWWLLVAIAALIYLGCYFVRVRRLLRQRDPGSRPPAEHDRGKVRTP